MTENENFERTYTEQDWDKARDAEFKKNGRYNATASIQHLLGTTNVVYDGISRDGYRFRKPGAKRAMIIRTSSMPEALTRLDKRLKLPELRRKAAVRKSTLHKPDASVGF